MPKEREREEIPKFPVRGKKSDRGNRKKEGPAQGFSGASHSTRQPRSRRRSSGRRRRENAKGDEIISCAGNKVRSEVFFEREREGPAPGSSPPPCSAPAHGAPGALLITLRRVVPRRPSWVRITLKYSGCLRGFFFGVKYSVRRGGGGGPRAGHPAAPRPPQAPSWSLCAESSPGVLVALVSPRIFQVA